MIEVLLVVVITAMIIVTIVVVVVIIIIILQVLDAVTSVWPSGRVAIRYSPAGRVFGPNDSNLEKLYTYLI